MTGGDDPVADVHDETAAAQEANCPETGLDPAQHIMALREEMMLESCGMVRAGDPTSLPEPKPEPEPEPEIDCYQNVIALREAHDAAAAALCEGLMAWHEAVYGHHMVSRRSQLAYQTGRRDGRSEMARECITDIDGRMAAMKAGTLAHQALSAHREAMLRKALP